LAFIITIIISCEKDDDSSTKFTNQKYIGTRTIYYKLVDHTSIDTVIFDLVVTRYEYSGTGYMDYGYGSFSVNGNSITFLDSLGRDAMHTWEWILSGTYFYRLKGDSLYFFNCNDAANITFSLKKM
jgi:hypothetical protein